MNARAAAAAALVAVALVALAVKQSEAAGDVAELRRYRRRRGRLHRPSPPPTLTPTPPPPPTPSPPLCNRTITPEGLELEANDCPPSPPPPPPPPPQHGPPCFCPRPPAFRRPLPPPPGNGGGAGECVTALAGLMPCGAFVTGSEDATPTPQSDCCSGLGRFVNSSSSTTGNDRILRCLCPVILGDVNRVLPKPIDPVRLMYLPIACGIVLPPQTLFICFTGHPNPSVVERFSDLWESTASSSPAPPAVSP